MTVVVGRMMEHSRHSSSFSIFLFLFPLFQLPPESLAMRQTVIGDEETWGQEVSPLPRATPVRLDTGSGSRDQSPQHGRERPGCRLVKVH